MDERPALELETRAQIIICEATQWKITTGLMMVSCLQIQVLEEKEVIFTQISNTCITFLCLYTEAHKHTLA